MANPQNTATMQRGAKVAPQTNSMAIIAPLAGWLLPGLGHFIQRRWIRGLLLMVAILHHVLRRAGHAGQGVLV